MGELRSLRTLALVELDTRVAGEALGILGRYGGDGIGGRDAVVLGHDASSQRET